MTCALLGSFKVIKDNFEIRKINRYSNKQNHLDYFLLGESRNLAKKCSVQAENDQPLLSCEL